jgi:hypothetical protein
MDYIRYHEVRLDDGRIRLIIADGPSELMSMHHIDGATRTDARWALKAAAENRLGHGNFTYERSDAA